MFDNPLRRLVKASSIFKEKILFSPLSFFRSQPLAFYQSFEALSPDSF